MCYKTALFALFALYLHQGEALKCYTCNSATDPKCMDKVESMQLTECTPDMFKQGITWLKDTLSSARDTLGMSNFPWMGSEFACVMVVIIDGDKKQVVRTCSVPNNKKFDFCDRLDQTKSSFICSECNNTGCNGTWGLTPSGGLFLLIATLATLFCRL